MATENATAVLCQVDQALIDRVFSATRFLNGEAMQYFVEQLIQAREREMIEKATRAVSLCG